ncbi:phage head-tail adapter protein [Clostridium botulinum]|uniref:phage head completion protein n=1 Tax=Clostridium TaxID=1485 RepID=UPI000597BAB6|nr:MULTISPECIES: head-tail adaptor protein [Clostridium]KIL09249.1 phage head-tail adapter protein [Clostridium botulinum]MBY6932949.1 head-tail adaptor protein [Clostridium botulinum]MCS6103468.1 phage head-tail adapter protein [Clostridium botulinum]MCS6106513.1 phage head-tail adapter protein [Clostridium botulinum]MCS6130395.1 phage head-tail adapter protein [Clostridium botulinum]
MSINSNMKPIMLQKKEKVKSPTGAKKEQWVDVKVINVAIYKTNDMLNTNSTKYNESSHTGITFYKDIKENMNRLVKDKTVYNVTSANPQGRLTNLLLKVVDTNV